MRGNKGLGVRGICTVRGVPRKRPMPMSCPSPSVMVKPLQLIRMKSRAWLRQRGGFDF